MSESREGRVSAAYAGKAEAGLMGWKRWSGCGGGEASGTRIGVRGRCGGNRNMAGWEGRVLRSRSDSQANEDANARVGEGEWAVAESESW